MNSPSEQFSLIYDQYVEKIYRFVYLKVNSQEIAQDITSKVFLNGWGSYQKGPENIKNTGAFLYQIARNMVTDHYREKSKTKMVSTDFIGQIADNRTNLHERAVLGSDVEMVRSAMQNLKKGYQDVLIWYYLEDMPIEEICGILNKSNGAVRIMIHRGLNALKGELREQV
ncbi:MAG: sigma-70 family RNA polymerase sigma factor [Patescibacteria group bacterium]